MIDVRCYGCRHQFQVSDDQADCRVICPECGWAVVADESSRAEPTPEPVGATAEATTTAADRVAANSHPPSGHAWPTGVDNVQHGTDLPAGAEDVDGSHDGAERNLLPEDEDDARRRNLFKLGLIMTIAFFAPVAGGPGHLTFPELSTQTGVFASGQPPLVMILRLLPLVAGVLVMVLARTVETPLRGLAVTALGSSLFVVVLADPVARMTVRGSVSLMPSSFTVSFLLVTLGVCGLLVSARMRWYRPGSTVAYWIGAVAGACYLAYLVLPGEGGRPVAQPFQMFRFSVMFGLAMLSNIALMAATAVVCMFNTPRTPTWVAPGRSQLACRLFVASIAVPIAFMIFALLGAPGGSQMLSPMVSAGAKYGAMFGGLVLLIPLGASDSLVGKALDD